MKKNRNYFHRPSLWQYYASDWHESCGMCLSQELQGIHHPWALTIKCSHSPTMFMMIRNPSHISKRLLGGVLFPDDKHQLKKGLAIGERKGRQWCVRWGDGWGSDCFHLTEKWLGNLEEGKGKGKSRGTIHIENVGARVYFEMNEFFHLLSLRFLWKI